MVSRTVRRKKKKDEIRVTIGAFRDLSDYKSCEEIQREVWNAHDIDIIPASLLFTASQNGGIMLGAYNNIGDLIGFVFSLLGTFEGQLVQHSHMVAVRAPYRNFDVGFKLKLFERKEALRRKTRLITSAIDPMQPVQAYFSLGKLGGRANAYSQIPYGEQTGASERLLPGDRIMVHWHLDSPAVARRLEVGPPRHDLRKELKQHPAINRLVEVTPGMTTCSPVKLSCTGNQFLFEIPYNLSEIKTRNLGMALEWQGKMRQVFKYYFRRGYAVTDFWVGEQDGHLRAFYVLGREDKNIR